MNSLSWLLYAADVVTSLSVIFVAFASLAVLGCAINFLVRAAQLDCMGRGEEKNEVRAKRDRSFFYLWIPFVLAVMAAVLPSRSTIYMIAASEAGEELAMSDDAGEMYRALKKKIHSYLEVVPSKQQEGGE